MVIGGIYWRCDNAFCFFLFISWLSLLSILFCPFRLLFLLARIVVLVLGFCFLFLVSHFFLSFYLPLPYSRARHEDHFGTAIGLAQSGTACLVDFCFLCGFLQSFPSFWFLYRYLIVGGRLWPACRHIFFSPCFVDLFCCAWMCLSFPSC